MTHEEFQALPRAKQEAEIERYNELEREWRGTCQRCGAHLRGTMKVIKEHVCPG